MSIYCALWGKGFQPDQVLSFKNQFHVFNIALENLSDEQCIFNMPQILFYLYSSASHCHNMLLRHPATCYSLMIFMGHQSKNFGMGWGYLG